MKKSVVAAVAASNVTIFSGLVDASEEQGSGNGAEECVIRTAPGTIPDPDPDNDAVVIDYCWGDPSCDTTLNCGNYYLKNEDGSWKRNEEGDIVEDARKFKCADVQSKEEAIQKGIWCIPTILIEPIPEV